MAVGKLIKQPQEYAAFIPDKFPQQQLLEFPKDILSKAAKAERLVGKLDGITHVLPDADFF